MSVPPAKSGTLSESGLHEEESVEYEEYEEEYEEYEEEYEEYEEEDEEKSTSHNEETPHEAVKEDAEDDAEDAEEGPMEPLQPDQHMWWEFTSVTDATGAGVEMPFLPHYSPVQSRLLLLSPSQPSVSATLLSGAVAAHSSGTEPFSKTVVVTRGPACWSTNSDAETSEEGSTIIMMARQRAPSALQAPRALPPTATKITAALSAAETPFVATATASATATAVSSPSTKPTSAMDTAPAAGTTTTTAQPGRPPMAPKAKTGTTTATTATTAPQSVLPSALATAATAAPARASPQSVLPSRRTTARPSSTVPTPSLGRHSSADDRPSFYERLLSQGSSSGGGGDGGGGGRVDSVEDVHGAGPLAGVIASHMSNTGPIAGSSASAADDDGHSPDALGSPVKRRLTQHDVPPSLTDTLKNTTGVKTGGASHPVRALAPELLATVTASDRPGPVAPATKACPPALPITPPPRGLALPVRSHVGSAGHHGIARPAVAAAQSPSRASPVLPWLSGSPVASTTDAHRPRYAELVACPTAALSDGPGLRCTTTSAAAAPPATPTARTMTDGGCHARVPARRPSARGRVRDPAASGSSRSQQQQQQQPRHAVVPVRFDIKSTVDGDVVETDVLAGYKYWNLADPPLCARTPVPSAILDAYEDREADQYRLHSRHYRTLVLEAAEAVGGATGDAILDSYLTTMPSRCPPDQLAQSAGEEEDAATVCTPAPWLMAPKHKKTFYTSHVNYDALLAEQEALLEQAAPRGT